MSVLRLPLTTVTLMLHVPTLLGASPVCVTKGTLEMEPFVKVHIANSHSDCCLQYLNSDIDECVSTGELNNCSSNGTCYNTPGGFNCVCNQGYTGNGVICNGS